MKNRHHRMIFGVFAAVLIAAAMGGNASAQEREHYPYRASIHREDYEKAEQALRAMAGKQLIHGEKRWVLMVDLARIYRLQGDTKRATAVLKQLNKDQASMPYARLETATLNLKGDDESKIKGKADITRLRHESDPLVKHGANYQLALLDFERGAYDYCISRCDRIIRGVQKLKLYQHPDASELHHLAALARQLKARAEAALLIQEFGDDYYHYRQGRHAQARGDYEKAIEEYLQVEADILDDAAECYIADCAAALGLVPEATQRYQDFIASEHYGLYRGEAMLSLARLQLLHATSKSQLKAVEKQLSDTLAWHEQVARQTPSVSVASIQKILAAFPPPDQFTKRDSWGNYHRNLAGPATILNRLSSTWYLQELKVQTTLLHGFALNELGRRKEALAAFERTLELNNQYGGYILNLSGLPKRLLADARDGAFLIPPSARSALSAKHGLRTHLAFLHLTVNAPDQARPLFEDVLEATSNRPEHQADRAAAVLGLACVAFQANDTNAALASLRRFDTEFAQTSLAPLAHLFAGNILSGGKDNEAYKEALQRYAGVAKKTAGSSYASRAWLSMAVAALNRGDHETARKACRQAASGDGDYRDAARTLAALIEASADEANNTTTAARSNAARSGRVIPISRHFVYPGELDLRYDMSRLTAGDLLDYHIAFSIRAGCTIKNFRHTTTIFDPQAPPTDQSPLTFVRAPVLLGDM